MSKHEIRPSTSSGRTGRWVNPISTIILLDLRHPLCYPLRPEGASKDDIAVTPLAVPILAGPGAITAVVLLTSKATDFFQHGVVVCNIFLVSVIVFLTLRTAALRSSIFSAITLKIIARLMGLLLAAVATQFILDGIQDVTNFW